MILRRTLSVCVLFYTFSSTVSFTGLDIQPTPSVEIIYEPTEFSEGPHWDHDKQQLYFVDIFGKSVKRYDPITSVTTSVYLDDSPSLVIPIEGENNKFVVTLDTKIAVMTWDGNSAEPTNIEVLTSVGNPHDGSRINDGKADALGRLWAGTMGPRIGGVVDFKPEAGVLFKLEKNCETATIQAVGITISNGIAWSLDHKKMYYVDSTPRVIYVFDYDLELGKISNPNILFDFETNGLKGIPDGMTIDAEGKLWVACFGGGQVIRVDPVTGKLLQKIPIPSIQTTSVAFGGANLDELFVTSANLELTPEMIADYPYPGRIFRVTGLGVRGLPAQRVDL